MSSKLQAREAMMQRVDMARGGNLRVIVETEARPARYAVSVDASEVNVG
jgi:hypothetical protein